MCYKIPLWVRGGVEGIAPSTIRIILRYFVDILKFIIYNWFIVENNEYTNIIAAPRLARSRLLAPRLVR